MLLPALSVPSLNAQVATAELSGSVMDASGAAIPQARITATNSETKVVAREALSGATGQYIMT
ncbi:MAG: carboxypeptidase-like regulatory domain-containing protein, partial [Bryobacteraceae bacterium]